MIPLIIIVLILIPIVIGIIIIIKFSRKIIESRKFIPTHKVKLLTNTDGLSLRKEPNSNFPVFTKIENGTEIQHMSTGELLKLGDIKGFWFEIRTKDFIYGWCFSGSLEEI